MVSKTASKRAVAKAAGSAPAHKKARMDPNCKGVLEALQLANLPLSCRQMLEALAPKAFETAKEERHFTQNAAIDMIGDAIQGVVSRFDEASTEAARAVEISEEKRAQLAKDEQEKTAAVTEALEASNAAKSTLKELQDALEAAKARLVDCEEARAKGDMHFNKAKEDKAALENIVASSLAVIVEGTSDDMAEHLETLSAFLKGMILDESLLSAVPSSCLKKVDARGSFDMMVVQQIRTHFEEKLQSLRSAVEAGEPAAEERAALVVAKEAEVAEATKKVEEATQRLSEVEASGTTAVKELDIAQALLREFAVQHASVLSVAEQKADDLENFKAYNVACYELLKEKSSAPPAASVAVAGGA